MWTRPQCSKCIHNSCSLPFLIEVFCIFQLYWYYDYLAINVLLQTGCQGQFFIWTIWAATQGSICGGAAWEPAKKKKKTLFICLHSFHPFFVWVILHIKSIMSFCQVARYGKWPLRWSSPRAPCELGPPLPAVSRIVSYHGLLCDSLCVGDNPIMRHLMQFIQWLRMSFSWLS